jgi:glycosyltransferase involved in cell wall biosynthesis
MTTGPKEVSVLIPTFRRPEMLRRAVASCLAQTGIEPARIEIVVVDNSPEASARALVGTLVGASGAEAGVSLRYVHEPRPGISHARNTAIAQSSGAFLAFLDDDETAPPHWLKTLRDCIVTFAADAVLGPVAFEFDPAFAADREFLQWCYGRRWAGATGQPVDLSGTGNCMLRRTAVPTDRPPFDPELGLTGGEDLRFLMELKARGGRVVWCAEAGVTEYCPPSRTTLAYILRRKLRHGQFYVRRLSWMRPVPVGSIVRRMVIGAGQFIVHGALGLAIWPFARTASRKNLAQAALGAGKVAWFPIFARNAYGRGSSIASASERQG